MASLGSIRRDFAPWADPAAKPYIQFENVSKIFGGQAAVDDLSLTIYEREFFVLLGPSGCGKTTLLRMLGGFERPTSGRVMLEGQDLKGVPPYRRPVNMMFQSYALFPHMSVEKNIAFGLKQEGMAKPAIAERVERMLKLVKLEKFAKRKPHQLSGGQRQRVALARSLAKRPKVLLLDEPAAGVPKDESQMLFSVISSLPEDMSILFIEHDMDIVFRFASRIVVLVAGGLLVEDTPDAVRSDERVREVYLGQAHHG